MMVVRAVGWQPSAHAHMIASLDHSVCFRQWEPSLWRVPRLPLGVNCAASGSTNGKPGRGMDRSGESSKSRFRSEENGGKSQKGYIDQDFEVKKQTRSGSGLKKSSSSNEGEDPYRILENGQKAYLDELDVISLLEPPPFLRPFQAFNYNHAAFLWKKIGDIPEERRHRLLDLLLPRHINKMWELSKLRYDDPDLFVEDAPSLISKSVLQNPGNPIVWDGKATKVPWFLSPFSKFQKVFFSGKDEKLYGRVVTGVGLLSDLTARVAPLYFRVQQVDCVMATEEPCDLAFEYGDGQLHLCDSIPDGFPKPVKHIPPFNDKACDYIRAVGPGVIVGQLWVEGRRIETIPQKYLGVFIMVQRIG